MIPPQLPQQDPYQQDFMGSQVAPMYGAESSINNIVAQIDPQTIIDNLDHALKGEQYNKEKGEWIMNDSNKALVNDECRGSIISYLDGVLNNNTTMGNIDEKRLSFLMESVIETVRRMFVVNLERFGFVKPGPGFTEGDFYNRGSPDSSRMTMVSNMVYKVCFLVFTRALKGQESMRIFRSLSMTDNMGYAGGQMQQGSPGWLGKIFGKR